MNVYFTEKAAHEIESFFDAYEALYFRLYDDTGLGPAEEYIKHSYHESAIIMKNGLLQELKNLLSEEKIVAFAPLPDGHRLLTKTYERYRIFVMYEESDDTRIIYSIKIYRK